MIKHIVMWNLRGSTLLEKQRAVEIVKSAFEAARGKIPGLLHFEIGVDQSRIDYACDVVLYSEFESEQALREYATHPEHIKIKQALGDLRVARYQVDYAV
jgi:heme-degrading monooxygenase HmoA